MNAVENFAPFAAVVLTAHILGVSRGVTVACAAVFFFGRVAHAIVHVSGFSQFRARTVIFVISWVSFLVFALETLRLGLGS